MEKVRIATLLFTSLLASGSLADASPDAQGWNGPGWYVTGSAPPALQPVAAPNYILFEGPHALPGECRDVYDRFYSPVGICRFLNAKPIAFTKRGLNVEPPGTTEPNAPIKLVPDSSPRPLVRTNMPSPPAPAL